jgi:hypothetical protein
VWLEPPLFEYPQFHTDLKVVKEHMGARGDIAGIYGAKRVEAGMKFEN